MSTREARVLLQAVGLTDRHARRLLAAGFAGEPVRTRAAVLYDTERVEALARWPLVDPRAARAACPGGLFTARRDTVRRDALTADWDLSVWAALAVRFVIDERGFVPLVATVSGFVGRGAEITAVTRQPAGGYSLTVRDPGPWFEPFHERRWLTGPGRDWVLRGVRRSLDRAVGE